METGFLKRLIAGLVIAAPIVFRLGTADLAQKAPMPAPPSLHAESASGPNAVLVGLSTRDLMRTYIVPPFAAKPSKLMWTGTIPLDRQNPDTIENVRIAAEAVDFSILHPGEVFSFNNTVGVRTEGKGYREGLMYSNGEVVLGTGGGICILSTALYDGALESGLKILQRHPHSGPVSYADPGLDSAVSFGWADLRFKNNTEGLLIIRSSVEDNGLNVALYSTEKPKRTVKVETTDFEEIPYKIFEKEDETVPEGELVVKQKARAGYSVTTVRVIEEDGKPAVREVISRDTILPRHKIILIPPKTEDETLEAEEIKPSEKPAAEEPVIERPVVEKSRAKSRTPKPVIVPVQPKKPEDTPAQPDDGVVESDSASESMFSPPPGRARLTRPRTTSTAPE